MTTVDVYDRKFIAVIIIMNKSLFQVYSTWLLIIFVKKVFVFTLFNKYYNVKITGHYIKIFKWSKQIINIIAVLKNKNYI